MWKGTLTKTMKAQEECVALQAARLEFVKKASKGGKILRPLYAWSNNIKSTMKPELRSFTIQSVLMTPSLSPAHPQSFAPCIHAT